MAFEEKRIDHTLVTRQQIDSFVERLGKQISEDYKGEELYLICVLKGSFMFMADLIRNIDLPCQIDFMSVSSYAGEKKIGRAHV